MKLKLYRIIKLQSILFFCICANAQTSVNPEVQKDVKHHYVRTSYANESIVLKNNKIQFQFFKRLNGLGWLEILQSMQCNGSKYF